ncbi:lysophospholipid acyltransferase family protein [Sulfitobacter sp. F26169L]|uniref:lysophospholipid acyltransferase family protein n=1 Tax=Sulfitobacter sp. F26169L TaxID=2996015 RepID=UPI00226099D7|nr:lysophospholipid acyltransferase family protein [Sulfitobacter sp. F26169L]MCX7565485.1 lysophospholipid acyltransferase family protein [Sulfitobacter sp. F26169L]
MNPTWDKGSHPDMPAIGGADWLRVGVRGSALALLVFGGLVILLLTRLIERPFYRVHRPVTPHITQFVCRNAFRILGIKFSVTGVPMTARGAVVANHSSWLDIFALNAAKRVYFVSKAEVAAWPAIGWLARATGTVFIERNPARARMQTEAFQNRLLAGHKLLFFPEGTSTDGQQVLPFKTTLFQAFFAPQLRDEIQVQPVAVIYHAPAGMDPRFYGWWGSMEFAAHLLAILAPARQGAVEVVYCTPLKVADFENRKALAAACETAVRTAHGTALPKA